MIKDGKNRGINCFPSDFEPSAIGTEIPKFMVFHFLARFGRVAWPVRDKHIQKGGGGNIRDFKRNNTL